MGWMKRAVLVLVLVFPAVAAAGDGDQERALRITNGEWPPYLGKDEPDYGIASQIITRAFERAGYDIEYDFYPWSRSLYLAREGKRDGTAAWMASEERREDFLISQPIIATEYVFFHRAAMPFDWEEPADLAEYRIGLTRDYDYGNVIDQVRARGSSITETVSSDSLNFQKLHAGRIDLFPMDRVVGQRMIQELFSVENARALTWHQKPVREARLHLLLSRKVDGNRERIKDFNRAVKAMRREGEIERILVEALGQRVPVEKEAGSAQAD
ncbi:MAG: substrate-binding periplasmic protein [Pseudomonadota bacterium]